MADLNVERKRRSAWPVLLAVLLILVIAAAAWWYFSQRNESPSAGLSADSTAPGAMAPAYDPETAPPYPAAAADSATPADTSTR